MKTKTMRVPFPHIEMLLTHYEATQAQVATKVKFATLEKWAKQSIQKFGNNFRGVEYFQKKVTQHIKCNTRKK